MSGNTSNMNGNTSNANGNVSDTNGNISNTNNNASDTDDESLLARLRGSYVTNARSKEVFIPRLQLEQICTFEAVKETLVTAFPRKNDNFYEGYASAICHGQALDPSLSITHCSHAASTLSESDKSTMNQVASSKNSTVVSHPRRKIFAILVLIGQPRLIELFLQHSLCDDLLPFSCTENFMVLWSSKMSPDSHIQFPQGCDRFAIIRGFFNEQWSVLAPHFDAHTTDKMRFKVYDLHQNEILPIEVVSKKKYPGGFGLVEKVKIHSEHHSFNHEYFALKTMHPMMPDERERFFQQELYAFQMVKPGGHVIEICAAFKQGDSRSFLFPWAKGGNLNTLWAKPPYSIITSAGVHWSEFSRWICIQCHGIIRDVRPIHEPPDDAESLFGIHSDIKPDNILYFSNDDSPLGSLKVSDLGLMRFHRQVSRTMESASMGNANQTYRSPEHDMDKMRSRKIDIWAFGCLFAEFLTWAIRGYIGVEAFKTKRMDDDRDLSNGERAKWVEDNFFILKPFPFPPHYKKPKRKSSIKVWFTELINDLGPNMEDTFFPEFLGFIQKDMLQPDRNRRADCKQVENFLENLRGKPADSPYWRFNGTVQYQNGNGGGTTENGTM
ncbi:kinase-like domain-containing protein [Trichoderma pleuroticola]